MTQVRFNELYSVRDLFKRLQLLAVKCCDPNTVSGHSITRQYEYYTTGGPPISYSQIGHKTSDAAETAEAW
jgi:hypothetical protein